MRLADYGNKFLNFLAENLRRLAEFLSIKPPQENISFSNQKDSLPPADWLEKAQKIPAEQWIDFSSDAYDDSPPVLAETNPNIKESAEKTLDMTKAGPRPKSEKSSENFLKKLLLPKRTTNLHFLSFKPSDKKAAESSDFLTKAPRKSPENKNLPSLPKKNFRLLPSLPIFNEKPKPIVSPAQHIKILSEKKSQTNQSNTIFSQKNSVDKINVSFDSTTKNIGEKENQISPQPISQKKFNQLNAQTAENKVELPKQNPSIDLVFTPKSKVTAETSMYSPVRGNRMTSEPQNVKTDDNQPNDDAIGRLIFATPPWADLPDENLSGAFEEIETGDDKAKHLIFLEREQAERTK